MKRRAGSSRAMDVDVTCRELWDGSDHRLLSSVTVKRRKSWLLAASALASSSLGISGPALAADECGALVLRRRHLHFNPERPLCRRQPLSQRHHIPRPRPGDLTVNLGNDVTVTLGTASGGNCRLGK